jgi:predicted short-subunit dehydrogenase-like oxidoreductase (DUF2520 family)
MKSVVIIGAGRLGQTLGYLLQHSRKYHVNAIWTRHRTSGLKAARFVGGSAQWIADSAAAARLGDIVFITIPDDYIKECCEQLVRKNGFRPGALVIHCSGNFSSDILKKVQQSGYCRIASLHPLQSFASPAESRDNFAGTYCVYEGTIQSRAQVRKLIKDLRGIPIELSARNKPLYHAAGVVASNYLVTLLGAAQALIEASGFPKKNSLNALLPLVEGTIRNIRKLSIPGALTGPIVRGDVRTIKQHCAVIRKQRKAYLPFYQMLGLYTTERVRQKRLLNRQQLNQLRKLFKHA